MYISSGWKFNKSYMIEDTTEVINIKSLKVTKKIRYRIQENFTVLNYNRISSCLVLALQGNQLDNLIHWDSVPPLPHTVCFTVALTDHLTWKRKLCSDYCPQSVQNGLHASTLISICFWIHCIWNYSLKTQL